MRLRQRLAWVGLVLALPLATAHADDVSVSAAGTPPPGVGVGLGLGHPSGVVAKAGIGHRLALQGGLGTGTIGGTGLHLFVDVVYTATLLGASGATTVPLYVGGGLRYYAHEHARVDRFEVGHDEHVGLRVPVGLAIEMKRVPLDFFGELALVVDLSVAQDCRLCDDDARLTLLGMAGVRYWFGGER